jgi:hypothetical protein
MQHRVECPGCRHHLGFTDEQAGMTISCPKCAYEFTLPQFVRLPAARRPAARGSTSGTAAAPAPTDRADTPLARIVGRAQGVILFLVVIYFLAGTLLSDVGARNKVEGEKRGDAVARDTGEKALSLYDLVFEPVNRPVRPFLPKRGVYPVLERDNVTYHFDVAPLVAGFLVLLAVVAAFALVRLVLRLPGHYTASTRPAKP